MPIKSRNSTDFSSGQERPSGLHPWTPYKYFGTQSSETVEGTSNFRINGHWSGGGPFALNRDVTTYKKPDVNLTLVVGSVIIHEPTVGVSLLTPYSSHSEATAAAAGTTAIARSKPTNPVVDLSVTLGEMRMGGLPSVPAIKTWREGTLTAKSAGSEYLNVEFGWLPLVRDIRKFAYAVDNSDKIIAAYKRDSNRLIKRSYSFPEASETAYVSCNFTCRPSGAGFATKGGVFQRRSRRTWFEAAFQYYLPIGNSQLAEFQRMGKYARKLYGISLTPETLWNLSPWSWAADWFGNVGDVMSNISSFGFDGLVMRHAYLMSHTRLETTYSGRLASGEFVSKTRVQEKKLRFPATPYGFGVSFDSLNARQLAVVAALGLSKW